MFAASKSGKPAASGAVTDPNFNTTVLLLETTGTTGQQNNTFLDSSTNNFTITRVGTPTQGTLTPFSQTGWSGYFNGTTDYLTLPIDAALNFSTGDWTVETWWYPTSTQSQNIIGINYKLATDGFAHARISGDSSGQFYMLSSSTGSSWMNAGLYGSWVPNTWYHLAFVRSGSNFTLYVNGTSAGTYSNSSSLFATGGVSVIGRVQDYTTGNYQYTFGYISNARVVKGTAVYTSNFTPSTTPLTAISGTSLLTLQSNYFKDNSSNNLAFTVTGTPSTQAFSPFAPAAAYSTATVGGSVYFNGTTDYLTFPSNAAYAFGTGDFTIECWLYRTLATGNQQIFINNNSGGMQFYTDASQLFTITNSLVAVLVTSSIAFTLNTWNHLAVSRSGTTLKIFVNGAQAGSVTNSTNWTQTAYTTGSSGSDFISGYISNFRVVKGTAVYTAAFTPPTAPLTAITNTSLLLNGTNAGIYDATAKNLETTVGSAQASTAQSKFGGSSMLFNGTTDYLTFIDTPATRLGTSNFTVEGWVYLSAVGTARGLVSKGAAATGWSVGISAANVLTFAYTASTLTAATALSVSTWYYFAVVRSGTATGNVKIYLNGTVDATSSGAITTDFNQTNTGYIGADRVGTSFLSGYLDEVRVTRVARTITTPTAAQKLVSVPPYVEDAQVFTIDVEAMTPDDIAAMVATEWAVVRVQRDALLAACDWTQLPDTPADKTTWAAYRVELRNVTTQTLPVVWPVAPE